MAGDNDSDDIAAIYDLTPLQEGILFHCVSAPASPVYNIQLVYTLSGALDVARLLRCWEQVVARHAPLRTCFAWKKLDRPYQVVRGHAALAVVRHDWGGLPADEQRCRLEKFVGADRAAPFDLHNAPLMRLAVIALGSRTHRLVWTFHHIILEGWSAAIVLNEVWALYRSAAHPERGAELPQARPYVDYIHWLKSRDQARAEAFWRSYLAGYRKPARLQIDETGPAGAATPTALGTCRAALSAARTEALRNTARAHRLTLNTVVQGIWAILLGRYSGASDVVFGSAVSGRPADLAGSEAMVGLFVNVLPVHARIVARDALARWLGAFQIEQATVREYDYSSQMQVKVWSELPAGEPLFDTVVAFENWLGDIPAGEIDAGLAIEDLQVDDGSDQPLALFAVDGRALSLTIKYDSDRFATAAVERMLTHLRTLLDGFIDDPAQPIAGLNMLGSAERELLLERWCRAPAAAAAAERECVHRLVAAQAARDPLALAVSSGERTLTYAELDGRANQLAHHLRARGVGPEVMIAVLLERSIEMVVAELAILKAGAAYVPLDPALPAERVLHVLADTAAPLLVTQVALADGLARYGGEVLCLEAGASMPGAYPVTDPAVDVRPDERAYVIYTSGSTGLPKGVEICHAGLSNLVGWHCRAYQLAARDRSSHLAGLGFDGSVWELWPSLCAGASVHLVPDALRQAPQRLWNWLAAQEITLSFMPTPLAEAALREVLPGDLRLRVLLTGGDLLHAGVVGRELPFAVVNHYGPTENSVVATCCEVTPATPGAPPIGRPIDNVTVYVVDAAMNPVPAGFSGELCLGGAGLARGYLHQPDLTAERFVADPFATQPGARLYRTGDLVAFNADGGLEFLGRKDEQIKIRGFRIEPGEIEAVLAACAGVTTAAVVARADGDTPRLVAYVAGARDAAPPAIEELRRSLALQLPDYMLPASYVVVPEMPMNANGKVDREALPAPTREYTAGEVTRGAPLSAAEQALIGIWEALLEIDDVRADDLFLDLGGHSLLAIKVVEAFAAETGIRLKPTDVVRYSVRQLLADDAPGGRGRGGVRQRGKGLLRSLKHVLTGKAVHIDG